MIAYTLSHCTVHDGAALSRNNISAFWEDANWILSWRHTTLEEHIDIVARRIPRNLLNNRATLRHQKAVDPHTGQVLGYARWVLPPSHAVTDDGSPVWPEAMVPEVRPEEEAEIRRIAAAAIWNPNTESDALDVAAGRIKDKILARKSFLKLEYLAVHPENQGKGIATALVESGMRQADSMGLDIFVMAFKAGRGVYKRLGFYIEEELIQDDSIYGGPGEWGVYYMIYKAKTKSPV